MATATPKPTILEIDVLAGTSNVRDLTADEIAEREAQAAEAAQVLAAIEAKATARASALAKLAELGLTEEEIQAL